MKTFQALTATVLLGLVVGCSQEQELSVPAAPAQPVANQSLSLNTQSISGLAPAAATSPGTAAQIAELDRPQRGQSQEESAADINRSEKVHQRWNEALAEFIQKNGRLPGSLQELAKFKPELSQFKPAAGFQLELIPQFKSIEFAPVKTTTSAAYRP